MKKYKKNFYKFIYTVILISFVIGIVIIAYYPFTGRCLMIKFVTNENTYYQVFTNEEINNSHQLAFDISGMNEIILEAVQISNSDLESIVLNEWTTNEFFGYVQAVTSGRIEWKENILLMSGNDNIHIVLNEEGITNLQDTANSFLLERIMISELLLVVCLLSMMIVNVIEEKLQEKNRSNHGPIYEMKKFCSEVAKYRQYMIYAAKADLKAEVADSYLNRLWWLLEPLFNMLVYVVVFGNIMGQNVENYSSFIFSSLLMWTFFSKTINYSVKLVRNNKDIVTKVYVPKFVLLLSNMFLNLFKLLFSLIVLIVMIILFKIHVGPNVFWVIPAYVNTLLLSFGIGMIFLHYGVYLDDLSYAVNILLSMMMFLSGIFYDVMTSMSSPLNVLLLSINPMALFMDTMRKGLLYNTAANIPLLIIWFLISLILCCIGIHIVYKNENGYVKVV